MEILGNIGNLFEGLGNNCKYIIAQYCPICPIFANTNIWQYLTIFQIMPNICIAKYTLIAYTSILLEKFEILFSSFVVLIKCVISLDIHLLAFEILNS